MSTRAERRRDTTLESGIMGARKKKEKKKQEPRRLPYLPCLERRDGVSVWLVDGAYARKNIDGEFSNFGHHYNYTKIPQNEVWLDQETVPGGHDYVYEFVPQNEAWIDDDIHEDERGFVLFHELLERNLMAKGMDYDTAHDEASRLERHYRNHPAELHEALAGEGWE